MAPDLLIVKGLLTHILFSAFNARAFFSLRVRHAIFRGEEILCDEPERLRG